MDQFLGQIGIYSFGFPPKGWVACNGQILQVAQNQALASLLGATFGGNGVTTFGLPNLQSRAVVSAGQGAGLSPYALGQAGGENAHSLTVDEMPRHTHGAATASDTSQLTPVGNYWAPNTGGNNTYSATAAGIMSPNAVGVSGGQPHSNVQPYLVVNFCIALVGIYPSKD